MGSPLTLPGLSDLLAANTMTDLSTWNPAHPASGPQNQNVIDYSGAVDQSVTGCSGPMAYLDPRCSGKSSKASASDTWTPIDPSKIPLTGSETANLKNTSGETCVPSYSNFWCITPGRLAAFIGGLIFIAGGIYLLGVPAPTSIMIDRAIGAGHGR